MVLSADTDLRVTGGRKARIPLEASANPYRGSLMSFAADGYARELVAGEPFAGVSDGSVQTPNLGASDGDQYVDVIEGSFLLWAVISGAAQDDVHHGRNVYASADDTLTLTAAGNSLIGQVVALDGTRFGILARTSGVANLGIGGAGILALSAAATLTAAACGKTIYGDTQSAAFTLTLPAAADCTGKRMTFVRTGTGVNALTLDGNASENIDGGATLATMDAIRDTVTIESDGSDWYIVASRLA